MFEAAELGQTISKEEYHEREPVLREQLLLQQIGLRKAGYPVIVLFGGVDGAGKGETAKLLNEWMDPRWIITRAFGPPSEEESERPQFWRYWRDLPPKAHIGSFLSAWYSKPLTGLVFGSISPTEFDHRLERILTFERMLANGGALILKFWMHLGRSAQKRRLKALEDDPRQSWRVTKQDWKNWKRYDKFISAAERIIMRTSTGRAPWHIVEGEDHRFRSLKVGTILLKSMEEASAQALARQENGAAVLAPEGADRAIPLLDTGPNSVLRRSTVLSQLDMGKTLSKREYGKRLDKYQARLNRLHREARDRKVSTVLVFEGWDAGGKGGAIRRVTPALDARDYQVIPVAAPTDEERAQHYLWRFWRHLSRGGRFTFYDRSWYGRVLVERVEGFATEAEWRRSYAEINEFEQQLVEHGTVLIKFWIHITPDEQEARFKSRQETPYKRWKLTDEDWRNREKWDEYELAANDMIERTSTRSAPWVVVEGNDKRYARIKVLKSVCEGLETVLAKK